MANRIQLKRKTVSGQAPGNSDVEAGELVINTEDGLIFYGKTDGTKANLSDTYSVKAGNTSLTTVGALNAGSITSGFGNIDNGSSSISCGSLDLSDGNITNVGDIQLDSITGDGDTNTSITFSGSDVITFEIGGSNVASFDADGDLLLLEDLVLKHDATRIKFGNDAEIQLTHVADTGLVLDADSGTATLSFINSGESVSGDGSKLILTSNSVAFSMPTNDGSNGQVLTTDGSGTLSFQPVSGGGASALNDLSDVTYSSGDLTISSLDKIISGAITHDSSGTITLDGTGGISLKEGGSNTTLIRPTDFNGKGTILKSSNVQYYHASTDASSFAANSSNVGDGNTNVRFLPFNTHATADAADEPEHCFQAPCNGHVIAVFASSNNNLVKPFDPGQGFLAWQSHMQILERDGSGGANIFGGSVNSSDSRVTGTNTSAIEVDGVNHTNGEYQEAIFPFGGTDIFNLVKGNHYSFVMRFSKMNFDESSGTNGTTSKNQTLHLTYIISWDETTSGSTLGDWSGY